MVYHELEQWTWAQDIFSNANINKHKNDNQFSEHFSQKLSSQNTRNVISEDQDFKFFWGSTPPDLSIVCSPLRQSPDTLVIKIYIPILHSQKFGQSGHINKVVVWGAGVGLLYNLKITVIYPFYGVKC